MTELSMSQHTRDERVTRGRQTHRGWRRRLVLPLLLAAVPLWAAEPTRLVRDDRRLEPDGASGVVTTASVERLLRLEEGVTLPSSGVRVGVRVLLEEPTAGAGVVLVGEEGFQVLAGVAAGELVLERTGAFGAVSGWVGAPTTDNQEPTTGRVDGWLSLQLEVAIEGGLRAFRLYAWSDGDRPEEPALTAYAPDRSGPPTTNNQQPPTPWAVGVWAEGRAQLADLETSELQTFGTTAPGVAPVAAAHPGRWPLERVGEKVRLSVEGLPERDLPLESAPKGRAGAPTTNNQQPTTGRAGAKTSFPCANPYRYHYSGYAPGRPGSTAWTDLPPVDNDCDGVFNEDPANSRDDDGDGLVDEDPSGCADALLRWTSEDSELGEVTFTDHPAAIVTIRTFWPSPRTWLSFATLQSPVEWVLGVVRVQPAGGGEALVGRGLDVVFYQLQPASAAPLEVTILESGQPLADGAWLDRPAVFAAQVSGGSGTVATVATVDGAPYELGTAYAVEGQHSITVTAADGQGGSASATRGFGLDLSPPSFSGLDPASGTLLQTSPVTVTGLVSADAVSVTVAGSAATLGAPAGDTRPFTSPPIALVEGLTVLDLEATDHRGKVGADQLLLDLDTLAPVLHVESPAPGAVLSQSPTTVTGTVAEAHLDTLLVNGVPATLAGEWFTAEVPLSEGANTLAVTATDSLDRTGTASVTVGLDTTLPQVTITFPEDGAVVDTPTITVSGEADDAYLDRVEVNGIEATLTGAHFEAAGVPLVEGENPVTATAWDLAGHFASGSPVVVVLDTLAPTLTVETGSLPQLTGDPLLILTGAVSDPHLDWVRVNGLDATVAGDEWSFELTLTEGDNPIQVTAADVLGHESAASPLTVTLDTLAPVIAITEPADGADFDTPAVTVTGTVTDPHLDPATLAVNGLPVTLTGDSFSVELTLEEGDTSLLATAADTLGHWGSATVTVTVDTMAPVVILTEPYHRLVDTPLVTLSGTIAEPHLDTLTVSGVDAVVTPPTYVVEGVPLVEGSNLLQALATDTFGHGAASNTVEQILDTLAPELTVTSPAPGALVTSGDVTVTGTVADAHLLDVQVNGVTAEVSAGTFTVSVTLPEGTTTLLVSARDALLHTTEVNLGVTVDRSPPVVSVDAPALGAGECLQAGAPVTVAGTVADAVAVASVTLEVVASDGAAASLPATLDGRTWSVQSVPLGSTDGLATVTAVALDTAGHPGRAARSFRVDATAPVVTLTAEGVPFPGQASGAAPLPGETPTLLGRPVAFRAQVADGALGAPPDAVLTLDGAPYLPGSPVAAEGEHLVVATATDCAGHSTTVHAFVRLDLTAPTLLSTVPAQGALLAEGPATLTGTAGEELAAATVDGRAATVTGSTFTLSPLSWREGENSLALELTDLAGNTSSHQLTFTVSSIPPRLDLLESGLPIAAGALFTRAVTPEVRCSDPEADVSATLNGAPFTSGTAVDATGDYTLAATATDALDRTVTASVSFRVDLSPPPTITITSPSDGAELPSTHTAVSGTVTGSEVTVTVNGLPAVVSGDTWALADLELEPEVPSLIRAVASDAAGRTAGAAVTVYARPSGPQIVILEPADGTVTARDRVDVAGVVLGGPAATADGTVTVEGIAAPVAHDGAFRAMDVPLADGESTLTATATDPRGLTGTATVTVTSDQSPPLVVVTADGAPLLDGATFASPFTLRVESSDSVSEPTLDLVRLSGHTHTASGASFETAVSDAGGYRLEVAASDGAGNLARLERSFSLGASGCEISDLDPPEGSSVAADTVTLRGRASGADTLLVRVPVPGGSPFELPAPLADGTFALGDVPLPAVGDNLLELVCTDPAGGTSTITLRLERLSGDGPVVTFTAPAAGSVQPASAVTVTGTVSDPAASLTLNGSTVTLEPDGTFQVEGFVLSEGPNVLSARAVDSAGRQGRARMILVRDTRAPQVVVSSPADGAWLGIAPGAVAEVLVTGQVDLADEPHLVSVVVDGFGDPVTPTVDPDTGVFQAAAPLDGTLDPSASQEITVTATDGHGHSTEVTVSVHLDPSGPALTLSAPADLTCFSEADPAEIAVTGAAAGAPGADLAVNGATLEPATLQWQDAGDGRLQTPFSTSVPRPSTDGVFTLVARLTDLDGRWAGERRTLCRDTVAPEVVETIPGDGDEGVDPDSLLLALLSEELRPGTLTASDGVTLTRLSTGTAVAGQVHVAGSALAFVPAVSLAAGESYRLRLGEDLSDRVGHPLAAVEATFTVAEEALGAPLLDPLPGVVCPAEVTVAGAAAPAAVVRVWTGDLALQAIAAADGRFSLRLPLPGEGYHLLHAAVLDRSGTLGPEAEALVRVDCSGPQVSGVTFDRTTGVVEISLSEPVDPLTATVGEGVLLSLADDPAHTPQAATLELGSGDRVIRLLLDPAPDAWWQGEAVRLELGPPLADVSGQPIAPYVTVLDPSGEEAPLLLGEAYDDATGRPLPGVTATLRLAGAPDPLLTATSDSRGRYLLDGELAPGRYRVRLEREGYLPAQRRLELEPGRSLRLFDARMTPRAEPAGDLDPVAGGTLAHPEQPLLELVADPGAVPGLDPLTVTLTTATGQGLPDLLPLGWTALAAVGIDLETASGDPLPESTSFDPTGVRLTVPLPDWVEVSDPVVAARYLHASATWVALASPERLDGNLPRLQLPGPGVVALLLPDPDLVADPLPSSGEALRGLLLPSPVPELDGALTIDPPSVPPTGKATARLVAQSEDLVSPWPSGLAVVAEISERLHLQGGGQLLEAPFASDLVLYHERLAPSDLGSAAPAAAGVVTFVVSPSDRAREVLLEVGFESVTLVPYPEELERGGVISPGGGTASDATGVELEVPAGALLRRTAVTVTPLTEDELQALPTVEGFTTLAGVRLDLEGEELHRDATLRMPVPAGAPAGTVGLVLVELLGDAPDDRGGYPRLCARVTRLDGPPERLQAAPEPPGSDLPLDGIRREGLYLLLSANAPIGFATGRVLSPSGLGLEHARVAALGLGTADLGHDGGRYTIPAPADTQVTLTALHPTLDERATANLQGPAEGAVITLDLTVTPVPPAVVPPPFPENLTVPVATVVSVTFSEPLDPASVSSSTLRVELANDLGQGTGAFVAGAVDLVSGVTIRFVPQRPLPPGRRYLARFTGGVWDQGGVPYQSGPVTWTFTTQALVDPSGQVHPERFHLGMPSDGVAALWGDPGAVPAGGGWVVSPYLSGPVADPVMETFQADATGAFSGTVGHPPDFPVETSSEVWVRVFDPGTNLAAHFRLGPFSTPDGRGFVAPSDQPTTFTTADGITVEVPEGAFDEPTLVTVTPLDPATLGVETPPGMALGAYVDVDFDGEANETLRIKIPAPPGVDPDAQVFVGTPMDLPWGRRLRVLDVGGVLTEPSGAYLSNDPSLQPEPAEGGKTLDLTRTCADAHAQGHTECFIQTVLMELTAGADAAWFHEAIGADFALTTFGVSSSMASQFEAFYNSYADAWVYLPVPHDWSGHVVLPVMKGEPLTVVRRDTATGWILQEQAYDPIPTDADDLLPLPPLATEADAPLLVDAHPFELIRFSAPPAGVTQRLRLELEVEGQEGGSFELKELAEFPLPQGTGVALYNVDPSTHLGTGGSWLGPESKLSPRRLCDAPLVSEPFPTTREHLLILGPGEVDPESLELFAFQFDRSVQESRLHDADRPIATLTDLGPVDECAPDGDLVPLEVELTSSSSRLVLRPVGRLTAGHSYRLTLDAEQIRLQGVDVGGSLRVFSYADWSHPPAEFYFATRPVPGRPIAGTEGPLSGAFDLLQLGNLVMVANGVGGLDAVDATTLAEGGAPSSYHVHASWTGAADQARALATDGHGRVFGSFRFGSTWGLRAFRLEDIRGADDGTFDAVEGGVKVAYTLGTDAGLTGSEWLALGAMPTGTPMDMEVLVQDSSGDTMELEEFYEEYTGGSFEDLDGQTDMPDTEGIYAFEFTLTATLHPRPSSCAGECPYDRYQRVSVDNLTTGQSWSQDIESSWGAECTAQPGSATFTITARRGDHLRVRRNVLALGYLAILGSGVSVVDLNRFYGLPNPPGSTMPGGQQCGRRLGTYEGQQLDLTGCIAGLSQGIALTPSVAVLGQTGLESGPPRGESVISTYSPVLHVGSVSTYAPLAEPGELSGVGPECIREIVLGPYDPAQGGYPPGTTRVTLVDVALAADVTWRDRGISGQLNGVFSPPAEPTAGGTTTGDLLFLSLGDAGIFVFDVSDRHLGEPIGLLRFQDHSAYRLQVDPARNLLFAGGFDAGTAIVDVWDLGDVNVAPDLACVPGEPGCAPGTNTSPRPLLTLRDVPWSTNHLGVDQAGTGLLHTWTGQGVTAVPFDSPRFTFAGLYLPEGVEIPTGAPPQPSPWPEARPTSRLVPLGVPMETSREAEEDSRAENERQAAAAFRLRVALPGSVGEQVTARLESLRYLPDERYLGQEDIGPARAPSPGDCWPDSEVEVTLRRVGLASGEDPDAVPTEQGPYSVGFNLYESVESVLLVADPRAVRGYDPQDLPDSEPSGRVADERGQCSRCTWPAVLGDPDDQSPDREVKELLVTGPYLRAYLSGPSTAVGFFTGQGDNYRAPWGTAEVVAWADSVPSPMQASLAEPAQSPAIWSPGEAGVSVSLVSGEAILSTADQIIPGRSLAMVLDRTYRSGTLGSGPLGAAGWHSRLFVHLRENPFTHEVEYHDGSGRVFRFYPEKATGEGAYYAVDDAYDEDQKAGEYYAPKGLYLTLRHYPGGGFQLLGRHNDSVIFDYAGRPVEISDRHRQGAVDPDEKGSTLKLSYDVLGQLVMVEDDLGRRYRLEYVEDPVEDAYGLLGKVTDFAERSVLYRFDEARRLEMVGLPSVETAGGDLQAPGFPFLDEDDDDEDWGTRPALTYVYHADLALGHDAPLHALECSALRLKGYRLPPFSGAGTGGEPLRVHVEYDPESARVTSVGFPNDAGNGATWSLSGPSHAGPPAETEPVTVTTPWDHEVDHTIVDGRVTMVAELLQVTSRGSTGDPQQAPVDVETTFAYTDDGRPTVTTLPDESVSRACYPDTAGQDGCPGASGGGEETVLRTRLANATALTRGGGGDPGVSLHGAVQIGLDRYDGDNLLREITDPIDRQVELPVPSVSELSQHLIRHEDLTTRVVGGSPLSTGLVYDERFGRLVDLLGGQLSGGKTLSGSGPTLHLEYGVDARGRAGAGLPSAATLGSELGVSFDYDDRFNLEGVDPTWGGVSRALYDEWDRPVRSLSGGLKSPSPLAPVGLGPCAGGWAEVTGGLLTDRAYDAAGHLVLDRRCQDVVDPITRQLAARWVERRFTYNAREQLIRVEQTNLAFPMQVASVSEGPQSVLEIVYDESGRVEKEIAPGAPSGDVITDYSYDPAGRLAGIRLDLGAVQRVGYDTAGRVSYRSDGDGASWFGTYDTYGRLWQEWLPTGARVEREYDAAGNVIAEETRDADEHLLARSAAHFTLFGEPDLAVTWLSESPTSGDGVRITRRVFDSAGRTVQVLSGPADDPPLPGVSPLVLEIDPERARRELEAAYSGSDERPTHHFFGGVPGDPLETAERGEEYDYLQPDGEGIKLPWPFKIQQLERVPGEPNLVATSWTETLHDQQGRPVEVRTSSGSRTTTTYDRLGGAIVTSTGAGTTTSSAFDSAGRLLRQFRPVDRGATGYAYTQDGRLLREEVENDALDILRFTLTQYEDPTSHAWPSRVIHPDGSSERFEYNPDGTLAVHHTRDGLTLTFAYDDANRLEGVTPTGTPDPAAMLPLEPGEGTFWAYDALSRVNKAAHDLDYQGRERVLYTAFDLEGRPLHEQVGSRGELGWTYDAWGRPEDLDLSDLGGLSGTAALQRTFDTLDRLKSIAAGPALGADMLWGGGRLYGVTTLGAQATAMRLAYDPATWRLESLSVGQAASVLAPTLDLTWGGLGFGYRGTADDPKDAMKVGRVASGLLAGMGYSLQVGSNLRLEDVFVGPGSTQQDDRTGAWDVFHHAYGGADDLERMSSDSGSVDSTFQWDTAGRIQTFGYDGAGRRTSDDRLTYRWDWRGRLREATVDPDLDSPWAGHQVRYEYDALGRLLSRVHLGPDDGSGQRGFIEWREYLWEGSSLLAESGYGSHDGTYDDPPSDLFLRWRKTFLPGPAGLDDQVQVRVETFPPLDPSDQTYTYLRDELGSVLTLVEEQGSPPPSEAPLLVRYLYAPYGAAHAEAGPTLRHVVFESDLTSIGDQDQSITSPDALPGGVRLDLSVPADPTTLPVGLALVDTTTGTSLAQGVDYLVQPDPEHTEALLVMPLHGWIGGSEYRIELESDLTDAAGRPLVHEQHAVVEPRGAGAMSARQGEALLLEYDSAIAAAATLGNRFPGGQNLLFQGLWTDPVTGLAYARARWYDARNASWLSEDPLLDVDSPNLYAFVGWGPHVGTDPLGLACACGCGPGTPACPGQPEPLVPLAGQRQSYEPLIPRVENVNGEPRVEGVHPEVLVDAAIDFAKGVVHTDAYRDAGLTLTDPGAPGTEKLLAAGVVVIATADVATNFATGGGEGTALKVGEKALGRGVADLAAKEAVAVGTREVVEAGTKELVDTGTRESVEAASRALVETAAKQVLPEKQLAETLASAAAQLRANRIAGNRFRDELAEFLTREGFEVQTEVYKRTPFGRRYIDIEVSRGGQVLGGIETKRGSSRYLPSQRAKDMWLWLAQRYRVNVARQ